MTTNTISTSTTPPRKAKGLFGTIWEDGSSFDYENGYSSNGATPPLRKEKSVRISKETRFSNFVLLPGIALFVGSLFTALLLLILSSVAYMAAVDSAQKNTAAVEKYLSEQDGLFVIKTESQKATQIASSVIIQSNDGSVFKCAIDAADNEFVANAFVFCGPTGDPATFIIPLPEKTAFPSILGGATHK